MKVLTNMQSMSRCMALSAGILCGGLLACMSFCADEISVVEKAPAGDRAGVIPVERRMAVYERYAEDIRELRFRKPVAYRAVRKEEIKALFDKELEEELPEEEFNNKVGPLISEINQRIGELLAPLMPAE